MTEGKVFLVGSGPGDPGLITVRGRQLIESADAVVYDALANSTLLPPGARETGRPELYYVGKRGGAKDPVTQDEINQLLVRLAREGKRVVRLKGGDPFVFGRGSEEAQAMNDASVPFEVVPGVTAGIAAAAYAGIPVTHRGLSTSVTFVTGHEDPSKPHTQTNWSALAKAGGTIVLYMGVKTLASITDALMKGGMSPETPAAAIQWGTQPRQRTVVATLDTIAAKALEENISAPAIIVIGWSVVLRDELSWFEKRPLFGRRIVVTRSTQQAQALTEKLRDLGADVIEMPATQIARLDLAPLREAITELSRYQWLILTSQNAVSIFWEQLLGEGRDARALAGLKVAAVGPATAGTLLEHGVAVDVVPQRFVAEGLLEMMRERDDVASKRILYVTGEGSRDVLPQGLREIGAEVNVIAAYRSIADGQGAERLARAIEAGKLDLATFTSGSAVRGYVDAIGEDLAAQVPAASIGPQTSDALREAGIEVKAEAKESTLDGLVSAVVSAV
ncbi:MAG: uroporphyrinogen-III C-methyltransferase [Gemmatimonadetes bacterium]|nr:MAG: uroporphyrinogen-III C-methyltransferase [Gemmatimonadota bacterium]PYO80696.1 MAG: uroporphyrinogen-III C-methyltransferase [Gemmatimonadota bacterium]